MPSKRVIELLINSSTDSEAVKYLFTDLIYCYRQNILLMHLLQFYMNFSYVILSKIGIFKRGSFQTILTMTEEKCLQFMVRIILKSLQNSQQAYFAAYKWNTPYFSSRVHVENLKHYQLLESCSYSKSEMQSTLDGCLSAKQKHCRVPMKGKSRRNFKEFSQNSELFNKA